MTTFNINNHQVPLTDKLEQAFFEYYGYYSLPLEVKCRMDPKCKISQALYDDWRLAVSDAWTEYVDDYEDTAMSEDDICAMYDDMLDEVDLDQLLEQFETIFNLETA